MLGQCLGPCRSLLLALLQGCRPSPPSFFPFPTLFLQRAHISALIPPVTSCPVCTAPWGTSTDNQPAVSSPSQSLDTIICCKVTCTNNTGAKADPQPGGPTGTKYLHTTCYRDLHPPASTILTKVARCPSPSQQDSGNLCRATQLLIIPRAALSGAKLHATSNVRSMHCPGRPAITSHLGIVGDIW